MAVALCHLNVFINFQCFANIKKFHPKSDRFHFHLLNLSCFSPLSLLFYASAKLYLMQTIPVDLHLHILVKLPILTK